MSTAVCGKIIAKIFLCNDREIFFFYSYLKLLVHVTKEEPVNKNIPQNPNYINYSYKPTNYSN